MADHEDKSKRLEIAREFRAAFDAALARIKAMPYYEAYRAGTWISDKSAWANIHYAFEDLHKAERGIMQKSRIAKLNKVAA